MLAIGDVHIYVSDFERALDFWSVGLELTVSEKESGLHAGFARLDFPDGGPSIRLLSCDGPWDTETRPDYGARPIVGFDVLTGEFESKLVRLLEHGGQQLDEVETYDGWRMVTVADPDGNAFELLEVPPDA
jgi:predicted enzyme related to lactoylglutathione lyase